MTNSRRDFIKTSSAGTVGIIAGGVLPGFSAKSYGRIIGANNQINIAIAGFQNRGIAHIRTFSSLKDVNVVALCDIDSRLFSRGIKEVQDKGGDAPQTYSDFRRLLDNKDIDAVSIATPDHWHALHFLWSCQAGKDI